MTKTMPKLTGYDHHSTPDEFYKALHAEFDFDCDPCPLNATFDGLNPLFEWGKHTYVNPPYSNMLPWVKRAVVESQGNGKTIVMLLKCDPSTILFQDWILPYAKEIRFVRGRITFPPSKVGAPFPSMVVIFGP